MEDCCIIAGKICDSAPYSLCSDLPGLLRGIVTQYKIRFVVIDEDGSLEVFDKLSNGELEYCNIHNDEIELGGV